MGLRLNCEEILCFADLEARGKIKSTPSFADKRKEKEGCTSSRERKETSTEGFHLEPPEVFPASALRPR